MLEKKVLLSAFQGLGSEAFRLGVRLAHGGLRAGSWVLHAWRECV